MTKRERISDFVRSFDEAPPSEMRIPDYYGVFFQLWNAQRYYEAHDVLEQLWLAEKDLKLARFYQALIQAAGAFVHLQKNFEYPLHAKHGRRLRPAARLFALALRNLEQFPNEFRALSLEQFRQTLARDHHTTRGGSRFPPRARNLLGPGLPRSPHSPAIHRRSDARSGSGSVRVIAEAAHETACPASSSARANATDSHVNALPPDTSRAKWTASG